MNEQNTAVITSLNINLNNDNSTYSVKVETDSHTIIYPKAEVVFGVSENIAFPINVRILNKNGDAVMNYGLNLASTNTSEEEAQPDTEIPCVYDTDEVVE